MKLKRITILLCAAMLGGITSSYAVPAYPYTVKITQSDGSVITIRIHGDEFYGYTTSEDGYLLCTGANGDWYYAVDDAQGRIVPSAIRAKDAQYRSSAEVAAMRSLNPSLRPLNTMAKQVQRVRAEMVESNTVAGPQRVATKGQVRNPVILVNFQDVKFITENPKEAVYNLLNQTDYSVNGSTGSAAQYYRDNSNDQYQPVFDVYGPVTVSKVMAAYGAIDPVTGANDCDPAGMVYEACKLAAEQFGLDFSQYEDPNVPSQALPVMIFYAGHNQAEGGSTKSIWPHRWTLAAGGYSLTLNGVNINDYGCFSELRGGTGTEFSNIGTFTHEFLHTLGLPDFYDAADGAENGGAGRSLTLNFFDVMDYGPYLNEGKTPPAMNAYERWFLGWMEPIVLTETTECELPAIEDMKAYMIETDTENEYFLFETRGLSKWDRYLEGSGMMIFHVDKSRNTAGRYMASARWMLNAVNDYNLHQCFRLILNNGKTEYPAAATAFYPGAANVTEFRYSTVPQFASWNGNSTGFYLTDIKFDGTKTTFKVVKISGTVDIAVTPGQYDALLTWEDANNDANSQWTVSWREAGTSGAETYTKTVTGMATSISPLKPNTPYSVFITPVEDESLVGEMLVTTQEQASSSLALAGFNGIKSTYSSNEGIRLSVMNLSDVPTTIEWYIDNEKTTESYVKLPVGEHVIKAVATLEKGSKEYFLKYVTVK